ncbi:MAG: hypothetical protein K0S09_438 [Sphingobacteriaceae bacterium]|jgi:hypothetical protein|nr:hypothetical protein [Sphingobacteriaceae bacterium]
MKPLLAIIALFLSCISCKKNNDTISSIDGMWVESTQKKDTLYFDSKNSMFNLGRGKELKAGSLIPKTYSGIYFYETKTDSISIQYSFSSLYKPKKYMFKPDLAQGKITIGNFYVDSLSRNVTLTFLKHR